MPTLDLVLGPREFRLLEALRLNPRNSFAGRVRGERLTRQKGVSIEFSDYREYAEGDDLRHLDWNVLARLDHPVMKTYRDEEDLAVHLLLDESASMEFGEPSKAEQARRLACALGFVAMVGGDAAYPLALGRREPPRPAVRGRAQYPRLAAWAAASDAPDGRPGLAASLRTFAASKARPGVAVLVTDGMDPEAPSAIRALVGRGHEVWLLQVLSDVELDPDLEGDLRLVDCETTAGVEITANSYAFKEYRERLAAHNEALRDAAQRGGGRYALVQASWPLDRILKDVWRREGWLL